MNDLLIWDGTTAYNETAGVWLTHKYGSQWALIVDVGNSWSTIGVGCASRWDLSILIEKSSPMRFERLSLKICGHSSVIDEKKFS